MQFLPLNIGVKYVVQYRTHDTMQGSTYFLAAKPILFREWRHSIAKNCQKEKKALLVSVSWCHVVQQVYNET